MEKYAKNVNVLLNVVLKLEGVINMDVNMSLAEVQKFLSEIDYPASKDKLIKYAQDSDADQKIFDVLNKLPDKQYNSSADVSREINSMK